MRPELIRSRVLPTLACLAAIAAAALISTWPLFSHDVLPRGSDTSWHAQWVNGFLDALRQGHLYPRWIAEANRGYGAPTFVFYPPIAYWLAGLIGLAGVHTFDIFRIAFALTSFLSGLAFFVAARPLTSRLGATLGAVLYVVLPYHMLDLYDRFAYAEVVAFVWLPPIFLFVRKLATGEGSVLSWIGLVVAYAGVVMTHLPVAFMAPLAAGPYALFLVARRRRWTRLLPIAAAATAALVLAAVFVLPGLAEGKHVNLDWRMTGQWNGDWRVNFVYEEPKPDRIKPLVASSVTTQLILGAAAGAVLLLRARRRDETREEGLIQLALAGWTFFLQTSLSRPIWAVVPLLGDIQFPWRFGTFQLLATCSLCAVAVAPLPASAPAPLSRKQQKKKAREVERPPLLASPWLAAAVLLLAAIPALRFSLELTRARPYDFDEALMRSQPYAQRITYEYIPRGVDGFASFERMKVDGAKTRLDGEGRVTELAWEAQRRRLEVDAPRPARLRLRTFDYPGWQARVDGQPVPIASANPTRSIEIAVPEGRHQIEIELGPTWDRTLGAWVSAAAAAALAGLAALAFRRSRRTA